PIFPRCRWACSSAWLECPTVTAEVAGSSPVSPAPVFEPSPRPARAGCCVSSPEWRVGHGGAYVLSHPCPPGAGHGRGGRLAPGGGRHRGGRRARRGTPVRGA